ncbi:hypothetical protein BBI08_03990 [Planococcus halocryophilus]|uniref:Uncharacterized protein n=1 Tax=Planococcus halocryophilus TaxID=1215089 RepID=A0A1C7DNS6_9BACL|nr:hypothetical protein BBI08_03990 [Planococcus halocryophilus]
MVPFHKKTPPLIDGILLYHQLKEANHLIFLKLTRMQGGDSCGIAKRRNPLGRLARVSSAQARGKRPAGA